jgi:hypothetical protein
LFLTPIFVPNGDTPDGGVQVVNGIGSGLGIVLKVLLKQEIGRPADEKPVTVHEYSLLNNNELLIINLAFTEVVGAFTEFIKDPLIITGVKVVPLTEKTCTL